MYVHILGVLHSFSVAGTGPVFLDEDTEFQRPEISQGLTSKRWRGWS